MKKSYWEPKKKLVVDPNKNYGVEAAELLQVSLAPKPQADGMVSLRSLCMLFSVD